MWRALDTGLCFVERAFLFVANGLLLTMLAINLANILSRLVLDKGILWVFPWTGVLFIWSIFLAFFVIYRRGQDVSMDILTRRMPPRLAAATSVFVSLAVLGLIGVILAQGFVLLPRQVGRIDLVGIQRYWLSIPFFVSCVFIGLQFVLHLRVGILTFMGRPVATEPGTIGGASPDGTKST